jgi:DNA-binding transcriptional regulator YdaS (Cro superfamily)
MDDAKDHLRKAVEILGGQTALGAAIGTKQQNIWKWLNEPHLKVPAEFCLPIEDATEGKVTRSDLRPDLWRPGETLQPLPPAPQPTLNDIALEIADTAEENRRVLNGGRG